jgi:hypothetical protein
MNPQGDRKNEPTEPEHLVRMLELELAQKRIARQRGGSPYRGFRMASFLFLFAVVVGAALAFYFVFFAGGLDVFRSRKAPPPTSTPSRVP